MVRKENTKAKSLKLSWQEEARLALYKQHDMALNSFFTVELDLGSAVQYRKWSPKWTANDPVKTWGMEWILLDWLQKKTDYKKRNLFLAASKEKWKEDATPQVNLYKAKKKVE